MISSANPEYISGYNDGYNRTAMDQVAMSQGGDAEANYAAGYFRGKAIRELECLVQTGQLKDFGFSTPGCADESMLLTFPNGLAVRFSTQLIRLGISTSAAVLTAEAAPR